MRNKAWNGLRAHMIANRKTTAPGRAVQDADQASQTLANNARTLRKERDLSLDELSRASGLSISTLSKIENRQISPTFDTLVALATGLDVGVGTLLAPIQASQTIGRRSICRAGQGTVHTTEVYDYNFLCTEIRNKKFTPLLATLKADTIEAFAALSQHDGEEFFYVLDGEVELHTDLYEPTRLVAGDCVYFDSTMGHALVAAKVDTRVIWVSSSTESMKEVAP